MGEEPTSESRHVFKGIERDIWIEEKVAQLEADFFDAIDAGDYERAKEYVDRFEASLDRLPPRLRHEVISETTTMLGDELKAQREFNRDANKG